MKIQHVHFEKLFGYFNYTIDFHDSVTIIHGPNGCGKTTMLKIIDATFNQRIDELKSTEFEYVEFLFSDGITLKIERKNAVLDRTDVEVGKIIYLAYTISGAGEPQVFDSFENSDEFVGIMQKILRGHRLFPWLERTLENDTWIDRRSDKTLTTEEVINKYGYYIYNRYGRDVFEEEIPEEVQNVLKKIDVRLISADRLTVPKRIERQYGEDKLQIERRVDIIATDLSKRIRETIQQYAQLSQAKDRTFPFRAIKQEALMPVEEIKAKMIELETKRKEFIETGILEEEKNDIDIHALVEAISDNDRQNLSLYISDTAEKLEALSSLSSAINLFRKLIDNSFNNKKIKFSKEYGFRFITTYSNSEILPQNLSSGEQHELVMFYDLIFNTSEKTLILIDEPELSLHIKWQLSYVDELLEIINITGFSAVLATHSPQIIHDKWDFTVSLSD